MEVSPSSFKAHKDDPTSETPDFDNYNDMLLTPSSPASPRVHRVSPPMPRIVYIRIDNLPPGKSWKQIRYFIGGIIHHSNVLQVKLLPIITSIVPPFPQFQSCIVTLKRNDSQLNKLLVELNSSQWEYHPLVGYVIPPPSHHNPMAPATPSHPPPASSLQFFPQFMMPPQMMIPQPASVTSTPRQYHSHPHQNNQQRFFHQPESEADHHSRKLRQIFNEVGFRKQMTSRGMCQLLLENFPPCLQLEREDVEQDHHQQHQSLLPSSQGTAAAQTDPLPVLVTSNPERYGKLKWTVLKDFIKLKCPKLLEIETTTNTREFYVGVYEDHELDIELKVVDKDVNTDSPASSTQILEDTTVALDSLSLAENGSSPPRIVRATIFKAVVGFHSPDLCNMCLANLQGQEYSLGYKLKVQKLPPYQWW